MAAVKPYNWKKLLVISVLATYTYVLMEWLFFVTMPSFMSGMSLLLKVGILFTASGILALLFLAPCLVGIILHLLFGRYRFSRVFIWLAALFPALVMGVLLLLLVDNFTYTIFHFGIVTASGIGRGAYLAFFLLLLALLLSWLVRLLRPAAGSRPFPKRNLLLPAALLIVSGLLGVAQYEAAGLRDGASGVSISDRPNILLIGSDGVNANHMSVYGYERDTTPFLRQLAADSLVAENAYTNFGYSSWSVVSILTGKSPVESHLTDNKILTATNSYEHLPGILRNYGYSAVQLAVPEYVDAIKMNFQNAFDMVNGQPGVDHPILKLGGRLGLGNVSYFISIMNERVSDRLLHIAYLQQMANPFLDVTQPGKQVNLEDQQKVDEVIQLLRNTDSPIFIHVHLLGTHGAKFFPSRQVYSAGEPQIQDWMPDFYDDSILDFDLYIKQIVDTLAESGILDDTIIIIYSDHGFNYSTYDRIPLMIHFPTGGNAGIIQNNAQNIDIAPTILDYLGISRPDWMKGFSLLDGEPPKDRIVFSENNIFFVNLVQCDRWYIFDLVYKIWDTGLVSGHTSPCGSQVASKQNIPQDIVDLLGDAYTGMDETPSDQATYEIETIRVSRSQVAIRLLQYKNGASYTPPPPRGIFEDVPASDPDAAWLEQVYQMGIMDPCALTPLLFCPDSSVTRQEAAIFILKTVEGRDYVPPPAQGIFSDVPLTSPAAAWIEELYTRGITTGCLTVPKSYCPEFLLIDTQLIVLLDRAFGQP